jgi:hypothetical protein
MLGGRLWLWLWLRGGRRGRARFEKRQEIRHELNDRSEEKGRPLDGARHAALLSHRVRIDSEALDEYQKRDDNHFRDRWIQI